MKFDIKSQPLDAFQIADMRAVFTKKTRIANLITVVCQIFFYMLIMMVSLKFMPFEPPALTLEGITSMSKVDKILSAVCAVWFFIAYFGRYKFYSTFEPGSSLNKTVGQFLGEGLCKGLMGAYFIISLFAIYSRNADINVWLFVGLYVSVILVTELLVMERKREEKQLEQYTYAGTDSIELVSELIAAPGNHNYFERVAQSGRVLLIGELNAMKEHWDEWQCDGSYLASA